MNIVDIHETIYETVGREYLHTELGLVSERMNFFVNQSIGLVVYGAINEYHSAVNVSLKEAALDRINTLIVDDYVEGVKKAPNSLLISLNNSGNYYQTAGIVKAGTYIVAEEGAILNRPEAELIPGSTYYSETILEGMNIATNLCFIYYGQSIDLSKVQVFKVLSPGTEIEVKTVARLISGKLYVKNNNSTRLHCILPLRLQYDKSAVCDEWSNNIPIASANVISNILTNPFYQEFAYAAGNNLNILRPKQSKFVLTYVHQPAKTNYPTEFNPVQVDCDLPSATIPLVINNVINLIRPSNEKT